MLVVDNGLNSFFTVSTIADIFPKTHAHHSSILSFDESVASKKYLAYNLEKWQLFKRGASEAAAGRFASVAAKLVKTAT